MNYTVLNKSVTAPKGFLASGIHCGVKDGTTKKDLALVYSKVPCIGAGMYTNNKVKCAPIYVTKEHLKDKKAQAIICNSGNANCCTGQDGIDKANDIANTLAEKLNIPKEDVLIASTGVIGVPINAEAIKNGIPTLIEELSDNGSNAAEAIMTTDTVKKECAAEFLVNGTKVTIGAIAKGSGMIEPNMGTMLSFITTDLSITPELLEDALREAVNVSYNKISVDGDTSTNDTVLILANGLAENATISEKNADYENFVEALKYVTITIAKKLAKDGEGATKLIECTVNGAKTEEEGTIFAKSVITSSLVKTAMFGADANWGRILCALGYAGLDFEPEKVDVYFESKGGNIIVCKNGASVEFDEDIAKKILIEDEITIKIDMGLGDVTVTAWGCDLTYEYVKINGDYRS
ncbi:MAG: bifunctional glutamate N-acetyltransferase/amino-acid acetyltransferase ArgJ [Clostridium sp.]|nr:bifunctional glutamate N-acetyltransferase/amino-acid acetyltransferase ArgJ [Clostridium sp.]MDY3829027.1 bifunctional glutamate N-acetyltransferase/amino-acid acetyltransferase ArgJ [Clostridium sp.]